MFLEHKISKGLVKMDERKVHAILDWPLPSKVTELWSFLGLAIHTYIYIYIYIYKI